MVAAIFGTGTSEMGGVGMADARRGWATMRPITLAALLLPILALPPVGPMAPVGSHALAACRPVVVVDRATATSRAKARRNASTTMRARLRRRFPNVPVRDGDIRLSCRRSLLWSCEARVELCR